MSINRRSYLAGLGLTAGALLTGSREVLAVAGAGDGEPQASLSLNENPFGPSPRAVEAIQRELTRLARYNSEEKTNELIDAIAAKERIPRDQVVLGEILEPLGIHLGLQGGAGGEFIYSVPGYTALVDAAAAVGGRSITVPLDKDLRNDLPAISASVNSKTRAVFIVNPHNPSGTVNDNGALKRFLRETSQRALTIVDEAYLEFTADFATRSAVDLMRDGANLIVFRTFAKAYGLAGLDIGYGIVPKTVGELMRARGVGAPRSLNRLAVAAALASLGDQGFIDAVRSKVTVERSAWNDLLQRLKLRHTDAQGNFIFFDAGRPQAQVRDALQKRGVDIGRGFPPYDNWARISIGLPQENAVARDGIQDLLGRPR